MNRRSFLSWIPSISVFSLIPAESTLRKLYMEFVFNNKYEITVSKHSEDVYYDAFYFNPETDVMYKYEYDTRQRIHRTCVQILSDDSIHTLIENEFNSIREAKNELEEDLVLPKGVQ